MIQTLQFTKFFMMILEKHMKKQTGAFDLLEKDILWRTQTMSKK